MSQSYAVPVVMTLAGNDPSGGAGIQADIEAIADQFVQRMVDLDGECDFAQDIAVPYTLRVIMSIFGIPEEDEPLMLRLTQGIFGSADPEYLGDMSDPSTLGTSAIREFGEYFGRISADRRNNPTNDLATGLAHAQHSLIFNVIGYFERRFGKLRG